MKRRNQTSNRPTHNACIKIGRGKAITFERIGVAWIDEESQKHYFKPYGKQIIEDGVYFFPIDRDGMN